MKFYTNVVCKKNKIFYRGFDGDKRIESVLNYCPTLFLPSREFTGYKSLTGIDLVPKTFDNIREARNFVKENKEYDNFSIYGNTNYHYCYISDKFKGNVEYDSNKIVISNIDIEVASDSGFPHPDAAEHPIIAITNKIGNNYFVFGCGDFKLPENKKNIFYFKCRDESHLLQKFLENWEEYMPDIVTGWNIQFFDIPYLVNRIAKIFSENETKRLSPWKMLDTRRVNIFDKQHTFHEIVGISTLDYIEMYRKYSPKAENYKLDTIAHIVLGENKLDYSEYSSLHSLYKNDYQKFIEYNIKDVELVDRIDEKLQYINMVQAVAYDAKVNFTDVFTQVRMWDAITFNFLKQKKIVIPPKENNVKTEKYAGAYVKEPIPGLYNWVCSFDLNSLYPNLIAEFNISPETILGKCYQTSVQEILDRSCPFIDELKESDVTMAANGHCFKKDVKGFFPEILMSMYEDRKEYKRISQESKKLLQKVNAELKKRNLNV